ncbi:hypothetical protein [Nostoc sp. MG11]|uniref:hypothetical protein n=1 Tax=Nostoc sp. MG11 TaxID=2721166 RepID=UPI001867B373|nr:hypothetical protein [Nostoc sp. MG11]
MSCATRQLVDDLIALFTAALVFWLSLLWHDNYKLTSTFGEAKLRSRIPLTQALNFGVG